MILVKNHGQDVSYEEAKDEVMGILDTALLLAKEELDETIDAKQLVTLTVDNQGIDKAEEL